MLIVTGAEQGLGRAILDTGLFGTPICLPRKVIECGKEPIFEFLEKALKFYRFSSELPLYFVNNFGINHLSWIGETGSEDEALMVVNVMAPYWCTQALVILAKQQIAFEGLPNPIVRIVNVASATYRVNQRCTSLYSASKAALVQMTKVTARELAPAFVINAVAPGLMEDTEMSKLTNDQVLKLRGWEDASAREYALSMIPMKRFTHTSEVAMAVHSMLRMPPYVTGSVLDVMGGV